MVFEEWETDTGNSYNFHFFALLGKEKFQQNDRKNWSIKS
jgi:hypothetical protein